MEQKLKNKINVHMIIQAVLFVVLIAVDRFTKYLAYTGLKDHDAIPVIKDIIEFSYLENTGAAFGIFKDQQFMFYIITAIILVILLILWLRLNSKLKGYVTAYATDNNKYFNRTYKGNIFLSYLFAVLASGAVGNLIDRVFQKYVVDFIYFKIIDFPIFNFADICVTLTAVAFIVYFLFIYKEDPDFSIFGKTKKEKKNDWEIIDASSDDSQK